MLKEVVAKTLEAHGVTAKHPCFSACSKRLFEISKFYLKVCTLTSRRRSLSLSLRFPS